MPYRLGSHSRQELRGVHPRLVSAVKRAIKITEQDFMVFDGLRTEAEQWTLYDAGASHLLKSSHLKQEDGFGHAVDLVPFIFGKPRWELPASYAVARAMRLAAQEERLALLWGGCWERIDGDSRSPELMVEEYVAKRRRQARRPFVDALHFEIAELER